MKTIINFFKKNKIAQFVLIFFIGMLIGVLFYPSRHIEEMLREEYREEINRITEENEKVVKELNEKINLEKQEYSNYKEESTQTISKLKTEIKDLQSKTKETYYKIVRPDGTIEIKKYTESEINQTTQVVIEIREEFDRKVEEISERWKKIHEERVEILTKDFEKRSNEYKERIASLEKQKTVIINPKKVGVEVGFLSSGLYYGHVNFDAFGPIFLGVHTQTNFRDDYAVGAGIGVRF